MATAPGEHHLIYQPDHTRRALDLLLWQHRGKERIEALVRAFAAGAQLAENTAWAVLVGASTVDGAEGVNLQRWGEFVGEHQGDLTHEEYQLFIGLRVEVNTLSPTMDNVWSVLFRAVAPSTVASSYFVADGIVYQVLSLSPMAEAKSAHVAALIRDFRPAGGYVAVVEYLPTAWGWGTVMVDDDDSFPLAELIYDGRSRA